MKAINPLTEEQFEIGDDTSIGEIITDEEGNMFEIVEISDQGVATLEAVSEEEDWGE